MRIQSRARIALLLMMATLLTPVSAMGAIVCPGSSTLQGVDVSVFQGTIDWNSVAASGRQFAYARVSDGTFADRAFDQNYAGIEAAGLARGAYQFFRPAEDPSAQADLLLPKLAPGDLPPALDVEVTDGQSPATIAARIQTWVTIVQRATGRPPVILTSRGFWTSNVMSTAFGGNPLWSAQFGGNCPNLPDGWNNWSFWLYSPTGSVPGIAGLVDLDEFNGSLADLNILKGFAGTPGFSDCHGQSVAALAQQFGDLDAAAATLGFASVDALQDAIRAFCLE